MSVRRIKFLPPRQGHCETGACVRDLCSTNMRLVGIETHLFRTWASIFSPMNVFAASHTLTPSACRRGQALLRER